MEKVDYYEAKRWLWLKGRVLDKMVNIVNLYGPQENNKKKEVWIEIGNLIMKFPDELVCLMGDFNCVRGQEDRSNCEYNRRDSEEFNYFILKHNLLQISFTDVEFTWYDLVINVVRSIVLWLMMSG